MLIRIPLFFFLDEHNAALWAFVLPNPTKWKEPFLLSCFSLQGSLRFTHFNRIKSFQQLGEDVVSWIFAAMRCGLSVTPALIGRLYVRTFLFPGDSGWKRSYYQSQSGRLECQLINSPFLSFSQVRDGVLRCHQPDMDSPLWWAATSPHVRIMFPHRGRCDHTQFHQHSVTCGHARQRRCTLLAVIFLLKGGSRER